MAKINLDPMPAARDASVNHINAHFAYLAATEAHREQAWRRKREIATQVTAGRESTFAFAQEAAGRGLSVAEFAKLILSKQDPVEIADAREAARQAALSKIAGAASPAELKAIAAAL